MEGENLNFMLHIDADTHDSTSQTSLLASGLGTACFISIID